MKMEIIMQFDLKMVLVMEKEQKIIKMEAFFQKENRKNMNSQVISNYLNYLNIHLRKNI